ncbi:MAG: hypothetical protein LBU47_00215, partial [Christensenellaceae bacterium]|nr:hypothetical protein [Christensenellaceae bacterium]
HCEEGSDEAIQQVRAKATSKRRTLDCFAVIERSASDAAIAMTKKGRCALFWEGALIPRANAFCDYFLNFSCGA